jgi:AbrB family looped-hinge helix DNA binding protein
MTEQIVTVTRKGQATIPRKMRERHGIEGKALVVDVEEGVLVKPLPKPSADRGSLKAVFGGKTSREILLEAREEESRRQRQLLKRIKG